MRASTFVMAVLPGLGVMAWGGVNLIGNSTRRSRPVVAFFFYLPGFGLAPFQPGVSARVCRATEADFIPCPRMSVVRVNRVAHDHLPKTMDGHFLPDLGCGLRAAVVDGLENKVLLKVRQREKLATVAVLSLTVDGFDSNFVDDVVVWHAFVPVANGLILGKAVIESSNDRNLAIGCAVCLRDEVSRALRSKIPTRLQKRISAQEDVRHASPPPCGSHRPKKDSEIGC